MTEVADSYKPPYEITSVILSLVAEIAELAGNLTSSVQQDIDLRLRRVNRIKTIHGSLAIEGNTLSEKQSEYYQAINANSAIGQSSPFIEFMLNVILESLNTYTPQVTHQVNPQVAKLLEIIKAEMTARELMAKLNLKDRKSFRKNYLIPALNANLIEMTIPDKPNSRFPKYRVRGN